MSRTVSPSAAGRRFVRAADGDAVEALSRLLDLRDGHTARHSDRVTQLCDAVAERLGLGPEHLSGLRCAARLHDIGKIGIPDRILLKDGPLTAEEWAVMRCHAGWGADVLKGMAGFEPIAAIVRSHHERWDGAGYPDGLAGEDIPVESRIIGACDAFCSMTEDRPYRSALSAVKARELMRSAAGANFERGVVEALLGVLDDDRALESEPTPAAPLPLGETIRPSPPTGLREAVDEVRLPVVEESRQRLLRLLDQRHPPLAAVVEVIEMDPGLTAMVLARAGGRVARVAQAVEGIGFESIARFVARAPSFDVFEQLRASVVAPARFRLHAVATGAAVRRLGRLLDERDVDHLVAAALLHDVGKLVLARMHGGYPSELVQPGSTPEAAVLAERRALGLDHAIAGATMLRSWGVSPEITAVVAHHHDEGLGRDAELLRLADMLAHYASGEAVDAGQLIVVAQRLGLPAAELRAAMFDVHSSGGHAPARPAQPSPLSDRERDALRSLAEGKVYKEIAVDLGLSASTVRSHLSSAYAKLGVGDRAQAVLLATERGWL